MRAPGSEFILFTLISSIAPTSFVEGARLLRPFIVSVFSDRTLSSAAQTKVTLGRFLVFSGKLSIGGGRLPGLEGGLFLGFPLKGLTRRSMVVVFGPRCGKRVQRGLVRKRTRRTC